MTLTETPPPLSHESNKHTRPVMSFLVFFSARLLDRSTCKFLHAVAFLAMPPQGAGDADSPLMDPKDATHTFSTCGAASPDPDCRKRALTSQGSRQIQRWAPLLGISRRLTLRWHRHRCGTRERSPETAATAVASASQAARSDSSTASIIGRCSAGGSRCHSHGGAAVLSWEALLRLHGLASARREPACSGVR